MNISLPSELARFVRERVESGHYSSASEVVREALRCLASGFAPRGLRTLSGALFDREKAEDSVRAISRLGRKNRLEGISIEELIDDGREK